MKRILITLLICYTGCLFSQAQVSLKRKAPKKVTPVIVYTIKYTAPNNQIGYVVARNAITDSVIWEKQIYFINYQKNLERDVQDVFIDSLYIKGKYLMIHSERGKVYSIKVKQ